MLIDTKGVFILKGSVYHVKFLEPSLGREKGMFILKGSVYYVKFLEPSLGREKGVFIFKSSVYYGYFFEPFLARENNKCSTLFSKSLSCSAKPNPSVSEALTTTPYNTLASNRNQPEADEEVEWLPAHRADACCGRG